MSDDTRVKPSGLSVPGADELEGTASEAKLVPRTVFPSVRMKAHIGVLLADSYTILTEELRMLRQKVEEGMPLDIHDARKFVQYSEIMTKLAREEREQEKHTDPAALTDEELQAQAAKALELLKENK